jgi:hypothetical protein
MFIAETYLDTMLENQPVWQLSTGIDYYKTQVQSISFNDIFKHNLVQCVYQMRGI